MWLLLEVKNLYLASIAFEETKVYYSESDSSACLSVSQKLPIRKPYTQSCFAMGQFAILAIKFFRGEREEQYLWNCRALVGGEKKF